MSRQVVHPVNAMDRPVQVELERDLRRRARRRAAEQVGHDDHPASVIDSIGGITNLILLAGAVFFRLDGNRDNVPPTGPYVRRIPGSRRAERAMAADDPEPS